MQVVGADDDQAGPDQDPEAGEADPGPDAILPLQPLPAAQQAKHAREKTGTWSWIYIYIYIYVCVCVYYVYTYNIFP